MSGSNRPHEVVLLPGDWVGPEMADSVRRVVAAAGVEIDWQLHSAEPTGDDADGGLPESLLEAIRSTGVALKGRLDAPEGRRGDHPTVQLRHRLELDVQVRPIRALRGLRARRPDLDLVLVRENVEGDYSGIEHRVTEGVVEHMRVTTGAACERVCRFAFEYAVRHGRRQVTAVHKANILKQSDGLFLERFHAVAREYPSLDTETIIVDNLCMQLAHRPERFDVLVMGNLYGDIAADLCAGLVGGISSVAAINIGAAATVFEASHGRAPELVGAHRANPLPLLTPALYLLRHLDETVAAERIADAVEAVLVAGTVTPDLGGDASTEEMTDALVARIEAT